MTPARLRYAVVGTGSRATMYLDAICGPFRESAQLVALCDTSAVRARYHVERLREQFDSAPPPFYGADEFERLVTETLPDVVIVTSVDATHDRYVVAAMRLGCDVICEKPMTIDEQRVAAILDAVERSGRRLTVTFNYRYSPGFSRLRELLASGAVGRPLLVDFSWMLDTSHGADYFRRWHRQKANSGGLLVHKASHHFDLVNWWIADWPETVVAMGALGFYGRHAASLRGEHYAYDRYTGVATDDPFALDLNRSAMLRGLYLDAESETGYRRDENVFGDAITIEDTMAVTARYRGGTLLSYSLVAYSPWEGVRVAITGDRGRVELSELHRSHTIEQTPTGVTGADRPEGDTRREIVLHPMFHPPRQVDIPPSSGAHGGDSLMLERLFRDDDIPDPLGRAATHLDGAAAVLLGAAANRSIATGAVVHLDELGAALGRRPD